MTFDLSDYIDVNERITLFYKRHPEGSLGFEYMGIMDGNPEMIWGVAYAYRDREDTRPGVGVAAELAKGTTPYTRHSELQNLQTSCWGRAIAALGIGLGKKGLATIQEVEAARARQEPAKPKAAKVPDVDPWLPPEGDEPWMTQGLVIEDTGHDCEHGPRTYKEGVSKAGKPYKGWMCQIGKCEAEWVR